MGPSANPQRADELYQSVLELFQEKDIFGMSEEVVETLPGHSLVRRRELLEQLRELLSEIEEQDQFESF